MKLPEVPIVKTLQLLPRRIFVKPLMELHKAHRGTLQATIWKLTIRRPQKGALENKTIGSRHRSIKKPPIQNSPIGSSQNPIDLLHKAPIQEPSTEACTVPYWEDSNRSFMMPNNEGPIGVLCNLL